MREAIAPLIRREDYTPPAYWITSVDLIFDLDAARTLVTSRMRFARNSKTQPQRLCLHGEELDLLRVLINGESVSFRNDDGMLVLENVPADEFTLEIRNTCSPERNTQLCGLYTSESGLFTQCEAEGFRRITYFLDRPDVMAVYTVTLRANKALYPVLLSNGNLIEHGELENDRHFAKWHDPFPKPSYLFALVGADLVARDQKIRTRAGKDHLLQVYVRRSDLEKTEYAINSLIGAIAWDEARFNLALDLERFMIVAVGDFNMGAMENKGLNIFNTKYVLASPATATDSDYAGIESVVAHEYFHNWTGNRVTCRDWFQLSLKEGLTVFRDQEFSMDMAGTTSARAVKRIEDVRNLREVQFTEDAGPMAHPVRPDSYVEINNFYTATVYEKGAEVVRMMQTLVGRDGFANGMNLYFERHDGKAVTCDDFAQAIADANPGSEMATRLPQFKRWYAQAGTPRVVARGRYDAATRTYTLGLEQQRAATAGQELPFVIPVAMGLVDHSGRALALQLEDEPPAADGAAPTERVLILDEVKCFYTFVDVDAEPVASLLRGFSAPVILEDCLSDADLLTLLQHDPDPFNRWEAGQRLALKRLLEGVRGLHEPPLNEAFLDAMRTVLHHPQLDAAFKELVLTLPTEAYIAEQLEVVDPQRIHTVRQTAQQQLAQALREDWIWAFDTHQITATYSPDPVSSGRRALANLALGMLCLDAHRGADADWPDRAFQRVKVADNMTERLGALSALTHSRSEFVEPALQHFYDMFRGDALVVDKWFTLQARMPDRGGSALARVRQLMQHPDLSLTNPNRARSLINAFCALNPAGFHRVDAAGYAFWADRVLELNAINPQLASRLARVMDRWGMLADSYRSAAREAIIRVAQEPQLSGNVREVVERALTRQ